MVSIFAWDFKTFTPKSKANPEDMFLDRNIFNQDNAYFCIVYIG